MSTRDTRTDAERRYDAERAGSLYAKQPDDLILACLDYVDQLEADERVTLAAEADRILDADEEAIIDWILKETEGVDDDADQSITACRARNIAKAPAAVAIVRAHLDRIAPTPQERGYVDAVIDLGIEDGDATIHDWANRLGGTVEWCGVKTSPGVNRDLASTEELSHIPVLTMQGDALFLHLGGECGMGLLQRIEERIYNSPEQVVEVVRLPHHRLVCVSTAEELFILTEEEFASQV